MTKSTNRPIWFWIVSVLALIWNLMGVKAYLDQVFMPDDVFAQMTQEMQNLLNQTPAWVTSAFAVAVWGGAIGSLLLVLKKRLAYPILIISLIGALTQMFYAFFIAKVSDFRPEEVVMPIMIIIFGIGLVFFAKKAKEADWIS